MLIITLPPLRAYVTLMSFRYCWCWFSSLRLRHFFDWLLFVDGMRRYALLIFTANIHMLRWCRLMLPCCCFMLLLHLFVAAVDAITDHWLPPFSPYALPLLLILMLITLSSFASDADADAAFAADWCRWCCCFHAFAAMLPLFFSFDFRHFRCFIFIIFFCFTPPFSPCFFADGCWYCRFAFDIIFDAISATIDTIAFAIGHCWFRWYFMLLPFSSLPWLFSSLSLIAYAFSPPALRCHTCCFFAYFRRFCLSLPPMLMLIFASRHYCFRLRFLLHFFHTLIFADAFHYWFFAIDAPLLRFSLFHFFFDTRYAFIFASPLLSTLSSSSFLLLIFIFFFWFSLILPLFFLSSLIRYFRHYYADYFHFPISPPPIDAYYWFSFISPLPLFPRFSDYCFSLSFFRYCCVCYARSAER